MSGDLFIGLMSGTSLDGIDAVLVRIGEEGGAERRVRLMRSHFAPFEEDFRARLRRLSLADYGDRNPIDELGSLHRELAVRFAEAVKGLGGAAEGAVSAIGSHGVTVRHRPDAAGGGGVGFTLQLGDGATLAALTGIDVVADLRAMDVAVGGQGAPLAPAYHAFAYPSKSVER